MEHTLVTATELKQRLGQYLESSISGPVVITKGGRETAVILSKKRYEELQALEDRLWAERAIEAEKDGYLGTDTTLKLLQRGLSEHE